MKIIAGALKGMKLLAPKEGKSTRPTSAKVREAILHKIEGDLQGSVFIDTFCGTGAVGLEALSRGALGCYFIEKDFGALKILQKNMSLAHERLLKQDIRPHPYKVLKSPAKKALSAIKADPGEGLSYVLWADPPYSDILLWLQDLKAKPLSFFSHLKLIVLELSADDLERPDFFIEGWERSFQKTYGSTAVIGFEKKD